MKCISRDAFIEWLKRIPIRDLSDGAGLCRIILVEDFERAIRELPSDLIYDADSTEYGRWIPFRSEAAGDIQYCSVCGIGFGAKTKYCPNCGKRMYDNIIQIPLANRRPVFWEVAEKWLRSIGGLVHRANKRNGHRNWPSTKKTRALGERKENILS